MFFNNGQGFLAGALPNVVASFDHGEVAAATTISHGNSMAAIVKVKFSCTGGAGITMTALPNIQAGNFDGQVLVLESKSTSTQGLTLRDQSVVAGSLLRMPADNQLVGNARDSHAFIWNAAEGMWYAALGGRVNNL